MKHLKIFSVLLIGIIVLQGSKRGLMAQEASSQAILPKMLQPKLQNTDAHFSKITKKADSFFKSIDKKKEDKYEESYKHYVRWKEFWKHRIAKKGSPQLLIAMQNNIGI